MQTIIDSVTGNGYSSQDVPGLRGKTAVVTGATVGIGYEVTRALALAGAKVILLARKNDQGEEAMNKIKAEGPADLEFMSCDLGSLNNVVAVAESILNQEKRLDLIIADAGVGVNKFDLSADGLDRHFGVNHLGHFVLVNRLLPLMRRAVTQFNGKPRVIAVSSELHRMAPGETHFESKDEVKEAGSKDLRADQLYARSKLANILFIKGLVKRVLTPYGDKILANAVHPGAVHTAQQDQFSEAYGPVFGTMLKHVVIPFMRTPEQGSYSTLWAATSEDVEKKGYEGMYFSDPATLGNETAQSNDPKMIENLWVLSEGLVEDILGQGGLVDWAEK